MNTKPNKRAHMIAISLFAVVFAGNHGSPLREGSARAATPSVVSVALTGDAMTSINDGAEQVTPATDMLDDRADSDLDARSAHLVAPVRDAYSCQQADPCAAQAPAGCFCDEQCSTFGDCCSDGPFPPAMFCQRQR